MKWEYQKGEEKSEMQKSSDFFFSWQSDFDRPAQSTTNHVKLKNRFFLIIIRYKGNAAMYVRVRL